MTYPCNTVRYIWELTHAAFVSVQTSLLSGRATLEPQTYLHDSTKLHILLIDSILLLVVLHLQP